MGELQKSPRTMKKEVEEIFETTVTENFCELMSDT